jgi:octanoyl-[GcvH]:protein N-octanoyltransferase
MLVLRGRAATVEADRETTRRLVDHSAEAAVGALRVWYPHRQVAFGRRDARSEGYEEARRRAEKRGFEPVERAAGGRATAYTRGTLLFARAEPVADPRGGLDERYERTLGSLRTALSELGVDASRGEPPDSFCPGTHSLQAAGKLVGLAQRVQQDVALVAGVLTVHDHEAVADVLAPVYDALGVPFDPDSVGSLARAGGETDRETVQRTVEASLVGEEEPAEDGTPRVRTVEEWNTAPPDG